MTKEEQDADDLARERLLRIYRETDENEAIFFEDAAKYPEKWKDLSLKDFFVLARKTYIEYRMKSTAQCCNCSNRRGTTCIIYPEGVTEDIAYNHIECEHLNVPQ